MISLRIFLHFFGGEFSGKKDPGFDLKEKCKELL